VLDLNFNSLGQSDVMVYRGRWVHLDLFPINFLGPPFLACVLNSFLEITALYTNYKQFHTSMVQVTTLQLINGDHNQLNSLTLKGGKGKQTAHYSLSTIGQIRL
jgi:hypothetical protein